MNTAYGRDNMLFAIKLNDRGAVIIIVAITLAVLTGFGALAVDVSHLAVVRNELQNAADAGALAGARSLYSEDGASLTATAAIAAATNVGTANKSENSAVEINEGDVQLGHWSFTTGIFTASSEPAMVDIDAPFEDLDSNTDFINAVRVTAWREDPPAASFLARIFGYDSFSMAADAVAYLGFASELDPYEADQPIVVCKNSILINDGDGDTCSDGTMTPTTIETAAWTDFDQESTTGGTNTPLIVDQICNGNSTEVESGKPIATNNGEIVPAQNALIDCWNSSVESGGADSDDDGIADQLWELTLPVVDCEQADPVNPNNPDVIGVVEIIVLWITDNGSDPQFNEIPLKMGDWEASVDCVEFELGDAAGREACWNDFAENFNLVDPDGNLVEYQSTTIYFNRSCNYDEPNGGTGGCACGVLAEIPVLVE